MAAQPCPQLVSYEEFVELAEKSDNNLELHFGQIVDMGRPGPWHVEIQYRVLNLLRVALGSKWVVRAEMPYRALPQYEARSADVGVTTAERWQMALTKNFLTGSPELVIEVFSPKSNTLAEMVEKASLCLGTGALQFWVVNRVEGQYSWISVVTSEGTRDYRTGQRIPLGIADVSIAVDDIFA